MKILDISENNSSRMIEHLENVWTRRLSPNLRSAYAQGRLQCWLNQQPTLIRTWMSGPAPQDDRLWKFASAHYEAEYGKKPDLGLVTLAGNITKHRDATYAHHEAMSISLGECRWGYSEKNNNDLEWVDLEGGKLIFFNCKYSHAVENVDPNRWSINIWRFSS